MNHLVEFIRREGLAGVLLRQHRPDPSGTHCVGCTQQGHGRWVWPCTTAKAAWEAQDKDGKAGL